MKKTGLIVFIAGFCAIAYPVIWIRFAFIFSGATASIFLTAAATFILGYTLGAWIGRFIRSIIMYGIFQVIISIGGFFVPIFYSNLALAILPWAILMGASISIMLKYFNTESKENDVAFNWIYERLIFGALAGLVLTIGALIELFGLNGTLAAVSAACFMGGIISFSTSGSEKISLKINPSHPEKKIYPFIFLIGFAATAILLTWTRVFAPLLKNTVYSFAIVPGIYLFAGWFGCRKYRQKRKGADALKIPAILLYQGLSLLAPLIIGLIPFSFLSGYLICYIMDTYGKNNARNSGIYFAIGLTGCALGFLMSAYVFMPKLGASITHMLLASLFVVSYLAYRALFKVKPVIFRGFSLAAIAFCCIVTSAFFSFNYGRDKNDNMTKIDASPIAKLMAHVPFALVEKEPKSALLIGSGMEITLRSVESWGLELREVESIPVIGKSRQIIRELEGGFDLIAINASPSLERAVSGLFYSEEFYRIVSDKLNEGGMASFLIPQSDIITRTSALKTIQSVFPYVKIFRYSFSNSMLYLCICSRKPIRQPNLDVFNARFSSRAQKDLFEWAGSQDPNLNTVYEMLFLQETNLENITVAEPVSLIKDNKPYNEYFLLRNLLFKTIILVKKEIMP